MITTDELKSQIGLLRDLKDKLAEAQEPVKMLTDAKQAAEMRLIELLDSAGLDTFKTDVGRASVKVYNSARIPDSPAKMHEFLNFVREKHPDIWFNTVCMKSTDIAKFVEARVDEARALGAQEDPAIPGIEGITTRRALSFTKS